MNAWLPLVMAGLVLGSTAFPGHAEAGDRRRDNGRRDARYERDGRYLRHRDVVVIREYYRPYHRPLPRGLQARYYRSGYLPRGWAKRMRPVPVYLERGFVSVPRGYRRGLIDGHAVVYDRRGFILDVAVLF